MAYIQHNSHVICDLWTHIAIYFACLNLCHCETQRKEEAELIPFLFRRTACEFTRGFYRAKNVGHGSSRAQVIAAFLGKTSFFYNIFLCFHREG